MSDSNSSNIKTGWVLAILIGIVLLVVGFYFFNFNSHLLKNENWPEIIKNLSKDTGSWGTFGDYFGGILNPAIAAFAFYLIAKTYELQKRELEATRSLLEVSTNAQNDQIKLAALTALLNSNLTRIGLLESEKDQWLQLHRQSLSNTFTSTSRERHESEILKKIDNIQIKIDELKEKNISFERQIESFFEGKN